MKFCTFFAGERGRLHLRVHHTVLHPAAAGVRGLRRRQADEQPQEEDEADSGGAQQQQRPRQEAGTVFNALVRFFGLLMIS